MINISSDDEEEEERYASRGGDLRYFALDHVVKRGDDSRLYRIHQRVVNQHGIVIRIILLHLYSPEIISIEEPFFNDWHDLGHI